MGINYQYVHAQFQDLIMKTLMCVEPTITKDLQKNPTSRNNCFELYGFRTWIVAFWGFVVAQHGADMPLGPVAVSTAFTLLGPGGAKKEQELNKTYSPMGFSPSGTAKADLVFAGYGVSAPNLKYDDYAGLDVKGKFVVVMRRIPRYNEKGEKRDWFTIQKQ